MKNTFLTFVLILVTSLAFSQKEVPTAEQIAQFEKSKTYFVLDGNMMSRYNFKIREVAKELWKATPFDFITNAEYEEKRMSKDNSFVTFDQVWITKDKTKAEYNFLCLSIGGDFESQKDMPQLCTVPVSYVDVDEESYIYKLSAFIQIIQDHVKMIETTPTVNKVNVIHQYNKDAYLIKEKELYVIKDELDKDINTEDKFKNVYPYKFKFVTREELEDAIDNKMPNIVFLHKVGPEGTQRKARCWKTIIGTDDSRLYYFNYHMISSKKRDGLLAKDLKRIINTRK